jgi:hypothetical protein
MTEYKPFNQDSDPTYNREPGIAVIPGSNYQKEMAKHEQFPHDKWAFGNPGNPYTYRPYPKMLYRAEHFNGQVRCMAAPPDSYDFKDDREFKRAEEAALRFTDKCQRIVNSQEEQARAWEDGWRESPAEAVARLEARDRELSTAAAHRAYEDRNMSEAARREIAAELKDADEHLAEVPTAAERKRRRSA